MKARSTFMGYSNSRTKTVCQMSSPSDLELNLPTIHSSRPTRVAASSSSQKLGVTFRDSRELAVHNWYPYVEGFSPKYVLDVINRFDVKPRNVYDPFGGSGTAQVTASWLGIKSYYSEVNPFMRFITETKVNAVRAAQEDLSATVEAIKEFAYKIENGELAKRRKMVDLGPYHHAFPRRDFFKEAHLADLLAAQSLAAEVASGEDHVEALLLLACSANVVHCSNMTRRADLRRRRADEYVNRKVDVSAYLLNTVTMMCDHLHQIPARKLSATRFVSSDCRDMPKSAESQYDLAITSPPYLNGTNYFRNTKLELWYLGYIQHEDELTELRRDAVSGGINNVSKSATLSRKFDFVEEVAEKLEHKSPDRRIPKMVRHYFSDMWEVFSAVAFVLAPKGHFVLDIGDSRYYGVHVPTHDFLVRIAANTGLILEGQSVIARRHSRDKSPLTQVELVFRKGN